MGYQIAICDDEDNQLAGILSLVQEWVRCFCHGCQIQTFSSAEEFLFEYTEDKAYDILLLDVELTGISGIDLAKRIRADHNRAEIVFVTSHFEFIAEGYEVDALHYLTKPVSSEKLMEVLNKAVEKLSVEPPSVIITRDGETVKLYESDILYVESFLHYISIHTTEREYKIKENISSFQQKLSDDFYRLHRSYLVSLKHVTRISRTSVLLKGETELPLARGKYDDINRAFVARN